MILDFKEIPAGNTGNGDQDTFELFARDFFQILGYRILQHPDRGADGKKDLIIEESRVGLSGTTHVKWLVSCKHHAHSGKSVRDVDEANITDRVFVHKCDGFIGFYSTLPSTSLGQNFEGLKDKLGVQSFDHKMIEKILLESPQGIQLAQRYFSVSFKNYYSENPMPVKIFSDELSIECEYCGKNLLDDKSGIFVTLRHPSEINADTYVRKPISEAYFSCKGKCDHILKNHYSQQEQLLDQWNDISDFLSPAGYIRKTMGWLNAIQSGVDQIEKPVFEKLKHMLLNTFPYISREMTTEEKERIKMLLENGLSEYI